MNTFIYRVEPGAGLVWRLVLTAMAVLSVASITGRALSGFGLGPGAR